jgi:hypothetical protein
MFYLRNRFHNLTEQVQARRANKTAAGDVGTNTFILKDSFEKATNDPKTNMIKIYTITESV